jgi:hypothetical protein
MGDSSMLTILAIEVSVCSSISISELQKLYIHPLQTHYDVIRELVFLHQEAQADRAHGVVGECGKHGLESFDVLCLIFLVAEVSKD